MRKIADGKIPNGTEIQQLDALETQKQNSSTPFLDPAGIAVPLRVRSAEEISSKN